MVIDMVETVSKTKKIGGSLMVRIPKEVVDMMSLRSDELVTIKVTKTKKSGFGIAKGIGPYKKEKASDFD